MDQKPPVVPRAAWRGPWGEEHHGREDPALQPHHAPEKRTLSAGYDLSTAGLEDTPPPHGAVVSPGGARGASEPPLATCRSANASPLPALGQHAAPPALRGASSLNCSLEELSARREDLEKKRKMVQNERLREQETQRREQVRLEEILNMCAEYERQVQQERDQGRGGAEPAAAAAAGRGVPWQQRVAAAAASALPSGGWENSHEDERNSPSPSTTSGSSSSPPSNLAAPPTTPPVTLVGQSVHQNRIKTNGSLPRDKQRPLAASSPTDGLVPRAANGTAASTEGPKSSSPSPDTEFPFGFNFDGATALHQRPSATSHSLPRHFGQVRVAEGKDPPWHNGGASVSPPISPTYPQSPRTRIRTNAASKASSSQQQLLPAPVPQRPCEDASEEGRQHQTHHHHANRSALTLLSSPQGRPFGGTLPRSAVACSRGEGSNGVRNAPAEENTKDRLSAEVEVEAEELKRERGKLLVALAAIRRKMNDIERQQEEALRELEMEQALLEGELNAVMGKVGEEEVRAEELARELALYERKAMEERESMQRQLLDCQRRVEEAQLATQRLENDLLSHKDSDKIESLREQLKHQQETLEAERKVYEDLEFQQLEREAWWESGREEMSREASDVLQRARGRRERLEQLEGEREEARGAAEGEASRICTQRDMLIGRLNQGRQRLKVVERRLSDLSHMGVSTASWDGSPEGSSDPDESPLLSSAETTTSSSVGVNVLLRAQNRPPTAALSTGHLELLNGAQSSVQRKQSQDDLDRISRVTSGAPINVSSGGSLGRRTIESLRTIERNRQIHLVQQGSQVIEEERRRVEELKRRAQDEVRAKWEEGRLRVHASSSSADATTPSKGIPTAGAHHLPCNGSSTCATPGSIVGDMRAVHSESLNSIGGSEGEESSVTESSDAPAESTTSSEDTGVKCQRRGQRHHLGGAALPMEASKMFAHAPTASSQQAHSTTVLPETTRKGEAPRQPPAPGAEGAGGGARPISDASSEGEEGARGVRRRAASTGRLTSVQHQRPLTRYLPIRGQQLDLRAHMEWAGHQPDLCPHVQLSASVCRGHLLKAPAAVSASVVRRASSSSFGGPSRGGSTLLSGLRGGGWARRWFVFDRSARCFSYYTDSSEKKSRCVVDFDAIQDVYVDHLNSVKSPSPRLTFCVKTRERAFHLVAPSAEAMRIWVDVIFTGAEGYTGFEYIT